MTNKFGWVQFRGVEEFPEFRITSFKTKDFAYINVLNGVISPRDNLFSYKFYRECGVKLSLRFIT